MNEYILKNIYTHYSGHFNAFDYHIVKTMIPKGTGLSSGVSFCRKEKAKAWCQLEGVCHLGKYFTGL